MKAKSVAKSDLFRELPSVDELVRAPALAALVAGHGATAVTDAARLVVARLRSEIASGLLRAEGLKLALRGVNDAVEAQLGRALTPSLRAVINATGVILHTNLGRAPLSDAAIEHIRATAGSYSNLEFDVEAGARGARDAHVQRLFRKLVSEASDGREISTIAVNNNAAAVLLALNTLADGGEVIVSRGELVEIGGSFRIPDVMAKSGAVLREVGTTNRTRIADYEEAINERTRLLLRVHRSNFAISGFTAQATTAELVELASNRRVPLMEDLGSGALIDFKDLGLRDEPTVLDSLRAGVDIVTYSGDKLLGGPQAGMISGRAEPIARMRSNSLFRALRVDKLTYAALEATLLAYVKRDFDAIPTLRRMRLTSEQIGERAGSLAAKISSVWNAHPDREGRDQSGAPGASAAGKPMKLQVEIVDGESVIGGGAAPSSGLPTRLLALSGAALAAEELAARLRGNDPPIVARVEDGRVLLDLRTVFEEQDDLLAAALIRLVR